MPPYLSNQYLTGIYVNFAQVRKNTRALSLVLVYVGAWLICLQAGVYGIDQIQFVNNFELISTEQG